MELGQMTKKSLKILFVETQNYPQTVQDEVTKNQIEFLFHLLFSNCN